MKKKTICLLLAGALFLLTACGTPTAAENADTPSRPPITGTAEPAAEPGRQDGERYEGIIMLEGMEETVSYEHMVNKTVGFEMDYDYENFVRYSEADRECFVSIWDDPNHPENYLAVTGSTADAETVAAAISEELSEKYEITRETFTLDQAGNCIRIGAFEVKGGGYTADQMQVVYIIPADDGCRIAAVHFFAPESEGFSRRFAYMLHTLTIMDR